MCEDMLQLNVLTYFLGPPPPNDQKAFYENARKIGLELYKFEKSNKD